MEYLYDIACNIDSNVHVSKRSWSLTFTGVLQNEEEEGEEGEEEKKEE